MRQAAHRTEDHAPHDSRVDRRHTDAVSHAHRRIDDAKEFARLHKRIDDCDTLMRELIEARKESLALHGETAAALTLLTAEVAVLAAAMGRMAGVPELAEDVRGMMGFLSRISDFFGVLWKPVLFIAVLGGTVWIWATGGKIP